MFPSTIQGLEEEPLPRRKYLSRQVPEELKTDAEVEGFMLAEVEKHRKNPMTNLEIAEGQEKLLEAFGTQEKIPTAVSPALDAARKAKESPFLQLCAKWVVNASRGSDAQRKLQKDAMAPTSHLCGSQLYEEWDRCMSPIVTRLDMKTSDPKQRELPSTNPKAKHVNLIISTAPVASPSLNVILSTFEQLFGVSCQGVFAFHSTLRVIAIFDYHTTERYAVAVIFSVTDPKLKEEVVEGSYANPCLIFTPIYIIKDEEEVSSKHKASTAGLAFFTEGTTKTAFPLDRRWRTAGVNYLNYTYFDRTKTPFAELIPWGRN